MAWHETTPVFLRGIRKTTERKKERKKERRITTRRPYYQLFGRNCHYHSIWHTSPDQLLTNSRTPACHLTCTQTLNVTRQITRTQPVVRKDYEVLDVRTNYEALEVLTRPVARNDYEVLELSSNTGSCPKGLRSPGSSNELRSPGSSNTTGCAKRLRSPRTEFEHRQLSERTTKSREFERTTTPWKF